jgi:anti-sigma B factor antagonist
MDIEIALQDGITVIGLIGQIDGRTAPLVQEKILQNVQPESRILLDLSRVGYMSSAGLRMALLVAREITATSSKLVLVGLSEELAATMAITGFLPFFEAYETPAEGVAALKT